MLRVREDMEEMKRVVMVINARKCCRKGISGRKDVGAIISSFVNHRNLRFHCVSVLHEGMLMEVLMYER